MITSRKITGAVAAALLTTAVAAPAEAQRRYERRGNGGISLGDVVLGTIAVAGVATVVGALGSNRQRTRGYDDGRYGDRYGYQGAQQASVEACAYEAEREAGRRYGSRAAVQGIDRVSRTRDGYSVRGTVEVQADGYGREGWGRDGYGRGVYGGYEAGTERVRFQCTADRGRVVALRVGSGYAQAY